MCVAAAVTLVLTIVRLVGELCSGNEWLFGRQAGGGGSLLGIGWLIPVVGFWFGRRLARAGQVPADSRAAWRRLTVALVATVAILMLARNVLGVSFPTFAFVSLALPAVTIAAWRSWPALARLLLMYALLARLPILVITACAIAGNWGTHYERLAPGSPEMPDLARGLVLGASQLCIWLPLTIQCGTFAGLLAARAYKPTCA